MAQGDQKIVGISDRWFDNDNVLVAVVAVATEGIDWAAYQDAMLVLSLSHDRCREILVARATRNGDKISEAEARAYFPSIELPYRH